MYRDHRYRNNKTGKTLEPKHLRFPESRDRVIIHRLPGVLQERPIEQIEGISDVIDKMTENVEFADRFMNKNGSLRKTPLKKKRAISKLEFFIPEYEYRRLKKMKDPIETLERPVEHMTVYRNDGSSVTLTAENGRVSIVDSREKNVKHIIEADHFISKIL